MNAGRHETPLEKADRNWVDLLQELRVSQTGVQLLTGLLLTLPFQDRFSDLTTTQRQVYLAVVTFAIASTIFQIAPVALHRTLLHFGEKDWLVARGNVAAHCGLACLAVALSGAMWLIFDVVVGGMAGLVALVVAGSAFAGTWWVLPLHRRNKNRRTGLVRGGSG